MIGVVEPAAEYITDVHTAAELWPFGTRSTAVQQGTPLGVDPHSGRLVCYDPLTAFTAGEQRAAQLAILAANGHGKSQLAKTLTAGFAARGCPVIVPCDFKGEYGPLIDHLGGSAHRVGLDGGVSLLDPGESIALATAIGADQAVVEELTARRNQLLATVAGIARGQNLKGWEQTALGAAVGMLPEGGQLADLPDVFAVKTADLAVIVGQPEDTAVELLRPLALDVAGLARGPIGRALGTSAPQQAWTVTTGLAVDTSAIQMAAAEVSASVMVTCWAAALSAVFLARSTSRQTGPVAIIFDEIWRATRQFPDLADQIGGLLRMDRHEGIISILATHSWTDTEQRGGSNILARCAALAIGGMQKAEADALANAGLGLNDAELAEIRANATGGTTAGRSTGRLGRFLIKVGEQPGWAVQTVQTTAMAALSDTNQAWA